MGRGRGHTQPTRLCELACHGNVHHTGAQVPPVTHCFVQPWGGLFLFDLKLGVFASLQSFLTAE